MRKYINIGVVVAGVLATGFLANSMVIADEKHDHPAESSQDPAQMQKMMEKHMKEMKTMLKLNSDQEKSFDAFAKQKHAMMKGMMDNKQAMMKGKDMDHGKKGDMQGGQMAMMEMMSHMSFEQRLKMMKEHGEKMLATSEAGNKFYSSLSAEQKKKLNEMPKHMDDSKKH